MYLVPIHTSFEAHYFLLPRSLFFLLLIHKARNSRQRDIIFACNKRWSLLVIFVQRQWPSKEEQCL